MKGITMKMTKRQLRRIIKEEKSRFLRRSISEAEGAHPPAWEWARGSEAEGAVPSRQEIEDAVLHIWWSEGSVDLVDVVDFLKMVGWPERQIQDGLDRIG